MNKASHCDRPRARPYRYRVEWARESHDKVVDASRNEEARETIIGTDRRWHLLFVIHIELEENAIRLITARKATRQERDEYEI